MLSHFRVACVLGATLLIACNAPQGTELCVEPCRPAGGGADTGAGTCSSDRDCGSGAPHCHRETSRCVGCLDGSDCLSGQCDSITLTCTPLPDTCQSAEVVDLSQGPVTMRGDTSRAANDAQASCAIFAATGPDLVYRFTLSQQRRVVAVARPEPGSNLQPVLLLGSSCDRIEKSQELGCAYKLPGAQETRLSVDALAPGTYYLWLDSDGDSAGAFTLELGTEEPERGESCADPHGVLPAGAPIDLSGDTSQAQDDFAGSCGGIGAPDRVYRLDLTATQRLEVQLVPRTRGFYPVAYLRRSPCQLAEPANQLGCLRLTPPGTVLSWDLPRLEAGTYYLVVDGAASSGPSSSGKYDLRLTFSDPELFPPNDGCAGAIRISAPAGGFGSFSVHGDTSQATHGGRGSCGGEGPDLVYLLNLTQPAQVTARVTAPAGSSLHPVVYLRAPGQCESGSQGDQVACSSAPEESSAALTTPALPTGEYSVWVDGYASSKGPFTLGLDVTPPLPVPSNDTCATPQPVSAASGYATLAGTTAGANDDSSSCQLPVGATAPDVVYSLALPTWQSLSVDLQAQPGSLRPVVTLRVPGQCSSLSSSHEVFCVWGDSQAPERAVFNVPKLAPGIYYLWVDGDHATQGPFTVRVGLGPPVLTPRNDDCYSAMPVLGLNAALPGDTRAAANDSRGACGTSLPDGAGAPDVVYQFNLTGSAPTTTLTVTPDPQEGALFRPVVYVRGPGSAVCPSTAAGDQRGCQAAPTYGGQAVLTLGKLPAGSYYLWVDGAAQSSGKFSVKLQ